MTVLSDESEQPSAAVRRELEELRERLVSLQAEVADLRSARAVGEAGADAPRAPEAGSRPAAELRPEPSPWTLAEKAGRALWMLVGRPMFRLTFHNWYAVRRAILRLFGAKIGARVRVRPSVRVEVPWNLELGDDVTVGDFAILYSLGRITVGERAVISQYAHLCAGTHDIADRRFPLRREPITVGPEAWIGADAFVGPRVEIGRQTVLGARASAYKDLDERLIYVGNPARSLGERVLR